jgi:hypothetical protein
LGGREPDEAHDAGVSQSSDDSEFTKVLVQGQDNLTSLQRTRENRGVTRIRRPVDDTLDLVPGRDEGFPD